MCDIKQINKAILEASIAALTPLVDKPDYDIEGEIDKYETRLYAVYRQEAVETADKFASIYSVYDDTDDTDGLLRYLFLEMIQAADHPELAIEQMKKILNEAAQFYLSTYFTEK